MRMHISLFKSKGVTPWGREIFSKTRRLWLCRGYSSTNFANLFANIRTVRLFCWLIHPGYPPRTRHLAPQKLFKCTILKMNRFFCVKLYEAQRRNQTLYRALASNQHNTLLENWSSRNLFTFPFLCLLSSNYIASWMATWKMTASKGWNTVDGNGDRKNLWTRFLTSEI